MFVVYLLLGLLNGIVIKLTNDRVDIFGSVFPKGTNASTFSWHSKTGQRPLTVHILSNDWPNFSHPSQTEIRTTVNLNCVFQTTQH